MTGAGDPPSDGRPRSGRSDGTRLRGDRPVGHHQAGHRPRLLPLGQPKPVTVRTDEHGEPVHVRLPGKPARRVEAVHGRWRIDDEWWRETISREYRTVVLDDGRVLTLYHDLTDGTWYAQTG